MILVLWTFEQYEGFAQTSSAFANNLKITISYPKNRLFSNMKGTPMSEPKPPSRPTEPQPSSKPPSPPLQQPTDRLIPGTRNDPGIRPPPNNRLNGLYER